MMTVQLRIIAVIDIARDDRQRSVLVERYRNPIIRIVLEAKPVPI
jgi:hypothetical protein